MEELQERLKQAELALSAVKDALNGAPLPHDPDFVQLVDKDRKSTRLNSSHRL